MNQLSDTEALARRLPPDFVFGVASSAYQIEGAADEDGRGPSIWDTFSHEPGRTVNGETGDVACDHYHRWADDIALMRELGIGSYRFSVSWSRVLPEGTGTVNQPGLDFYDRLVDGLLGQGIAPLVTLYHWDLPQPLYDRGGWTNPSVIDWFGEYAERLAERLGDRVSRWLTLNEPQVFSFTGHADGRHAPGVNDWSTALRVADNAIRAHAAAADRIRALVPGAQVGVALNLNSVDPVTDTGANREAAERHLAINQRWFSDPLFGRPYPELAVRAHREAGHLPEDVDFAAENFGGRLDFLGLNYYTHEQIAADAEARFGYRHVRPPSVERTTMGWEVYPPGLHQVLAWLHRDYQPAEIMITEVGAAFPDPPSPEGDVVDDPARTRFLADHVEMTARAIDDGIPVTGLYAWSLLDNFEWAEGYRQRFGIVHVDYGNQRRTVKGSGRWLKELIRAHRAVETPPAP